MQPLNMTQILGDIKNCKIPNIERIKDRNILLDCRGYIEIHPEAMFGYNISIFTMSHDIYDFGKTKYKKVIIEKGAFIGSESKLYNCRIGEGAIVALGSVVRSMDVKPFTMVEGNPARVIAYFDQITKKWIYFYRNGSNASDVDTGIPQKKQQ